MKLAIIDYGSGNLRSAAKAFERAAFEAGLNFDIQVTADADTVVRADHIVLPGVGAFQDCRKGLDAVPGMVSALDEAVRKKKRPFFGICVGMQLMAARGLEHGECQGLGWIDGEVVAIEPTVPALKIPHMGWNNLTRTPLSLVHPVLDGISDTSLEKQAHAYFIHSYQFKCVKGEDVLATVDYGGPVTAAIGRENMVGTQFHPEKSQAVGLKIITNFLTWRP